MENECFCLMHVNDVKIEIKWIPRAPYTNKDQFKVGRG